MVGSTSGCLGFRIGAFRFFDLAFMTLAWPRTVEGEDALDPRLRPPQAQVLGPALERTIWSLLSFSRGGIRCPESIACRHCPIQSSRTLRCSMLRSPRCRICSRASAHSGAAALLLLASYRASSNFCRDSSCSVSNRSSFLR
jgi:hypothetical protein